MVFGYSRAPFIIHTTSMDQATFFLSDLNNLPKNKSEKHSNFKFSESVICYERKKGMKSGLHATFSFF